MEKSEKSVFNIKEEEAFIRWTQFFLKIIQFFLGKSFQNNVLIEKAHQTK